MSTMSSNLSQSVPIYQRAVLLVLLWAPFSLFAANPPDSQSAWLQQSMSLHDARHLVGRTGFGTSAIELSNVVGLTRGEAVDRIVDGLRTEPAIEMPEWTKVPAPRFWKLATLPLQQQQEFNGERDREIDELRQWWISNMLQSDSPQTERLVLFWHDHFATSYDGVNRSSISIARQNQLFRKMATGSYREFLKAMIRDPALLIYLDNQRNRKGRPNENLARELLELFTLGEGNFDEATVKEAARALTGYGVSNTRNHTFRLYGYKRDLAEKTLFGTSANHDGDSLIDLILEQPAAAEHLVKKFWAAFVSDNEPDPAFVDTLSQSFRESDYDLLALYTNVLRSEQFWSASNRLSLIKSPATLLIGTARTLDFPKRAWSQFASLHALLGMDLFAPPNVSGWKEGAAFVTPGRLLNRQLALRSLLDTSRIAAPTSQDSMMMSDVAPLQVRIAGHFFEGAPRYQVSLYQSGNGNAKLLWQSSERELQVGYNTKMFGEMQDRGLLSWQTEQLYPADDIVANATDVQIEFLNDAASKLGDRSLFVESVDINSRTFSAAGAEQVSDCAPKNKLYSGDLYCAGTVSIDITDQLAASVDRKSAFTATDARAIWTTQKKARRKAKGDVKLEATIALENVQTPDDFYHTLSFHLISTNAQSIELHLDSFSCWPDCIEHWPECAWHAEGTEDKGLVFQLPRGSDEYINCHYQSLTTSQKVLVNTLMKSLPYIIRHVVDNEPRERHVKNLKFLHKRMNGLESLLGNSVYMHAAELVALNANYETPGLIALPVAEPRVQINTLTELEQRVSTSDLTLADLLIGGVDAKQFPQLNSKTEEPFRRQLENLTAHPVYQVY